jgi:hypothetical protein
MAIEVCWKPFELRFMLVEMQPLPASINELGFAILPEVVSTARIDSLLSELSNPGLSRTRAGVSMR